MRNKYLFLLVGIGLLIYSLNMVDIVKGSTIDLGETNNSLPVITVTFSENVSVTWHKLVGENLQEYQINARTPSQEQYDDVWLFQPLESLPNQLYNLTINYSDIIGNNNSAVLLFEVNAPFMAIWLSNPPPGANFGMANHTPFYLEIHSEREAVCRYIQYNSYCQLMFGGLEQCDFDQGNLSKAFANNAISFDNSNGFVHNKTSFNNPQEITEGELKDYVIICNESGFYNPSVPLIKLGYDTTAPDINISLDPEVVNDLVNRKSVVSITSNDKVICRYMYEGGWFNISNYEPALLDAYRTSQTFEINFPEFPVGEEHRFEYSLECKNIAQLITIKNFTIVVRYENVVNVYSHLRDYYNSHNVVLNFTTDKDATCDFKLNNSAWQPLAGNQKTHVQTITINNDGDYDIEVSCTALDGSQGSASDSFFVDTVKPEQPTINISPYTCSLLEIKAIIKGKDNDGGSGIDYYEYEIENSSEVIINWTKTNKRVREHIDMSENESYTIKARAIDKAGNVGDESSVDITAKSEQSIECDSTAPTVQVLVFDYQGIKAVNISCYDSQSGCNPTFGFAFINISQTCGNASFQEYPYTNLPLLVAHTSILCWNISDNAGNFKQGSRFINVTMTIDTCNDGMLDGDETDIDCGGSCNPCENGSACVSDSDCISNHCINGLCEELNTCNDNELDGDETDIDCGGSCNPCNENQHCYTDSDCSSGLSCVDGLCSQTTTDNDNDGMLDEWELNNNLDPNNPDDASEDSDNDGLTNLEEYNLGTDPWKADTDGDGVSDGKEEQAGTDPLDPNSKPKNKLWVWIIITAFLVVIAGGGGFYYFRFRQPKQRLQTIPKKQQVIAPVMQQQPIRIRSNALRQRIARARALQRAAIRKQLLMAFETPKGEQQVSEGKNDLANKTKEQARTAGDQQGYVPLKDINLNQPKGSQTIMQTSKMQKKDSGESVFKQLADITKASPKRVKSVMDEATTGFELAKLFPENQRIKPENVESALKNLIASNQMSEKNVHETLSALVSKNVITNEDAAKIIKGFEKSK